MLFKLCLVVAFAFSVQAYIESPTKSFNDFNFYQHQHEPYATNDLISNPLFPEAVFTLGGSQEASNNLINHGNDNIDQVDSNDDYLATTFFVPYRSNNEQSYRLSIESEHNAEKYQISLGLGQDLLAHPSAEGPPVLYKPDLEYQVLEPDSGPYGGLLDILSPHNSEIYQIPVPLTFGPEPVIPDRPSESSINVPSSNLLKSNIMPFNLKPTTSFLSDLSFPYPEVPENYQFLPHLSSKLLASIYSNLSEPYFFSEPFSSAPLYSHDSLPTPPFHRTYSPVLTPPDNLPQYFSNLYRSSYNGLNPTQSYEKREFTSSLPYGLTFPKTSSATTSYPWESLVKDFTDNAPFYQSDSSSFAPIHFTDDAVHNSEGLFSPVPPNPYSSSELHSSFPTESPVKPDPITLVYLDQIFKFPLLPVPTNTKRVSDESYTKPVSIDTTLELLEVLLDCVASFGK